MRSLSSLIVILLSAVLSAQSPHGNSIKEDCSQCHESTSWKMKSNPEFQHDRTSFQLTGQHRNVGCRSCHSTLVFTNSKADCFSCHKDVHQNSVGFDCQKCHTTDTWVVKDINMIHRLGRFPLAGAHQRAECIQCHQQFNNLNFQPVGIECFSCHSNDYNSTQNPNHVSAHFSVECQDCHNLTDNNWAARNFVHDFFPLQGMHKLDNCFACHKHGSFAGLSNDCYSCHQKDYEGAKDPDHVADNFSHDCSQCHNTNNPFSFSTFNHNVTQFPLTGVHSNSKCSDCHQTGYQNTSTACVSCHQANYNNSLNPDHKTLGLSTDCQTCHNTTSAGFKPALFPVHNNYYQLLGAHALIASNCPTCHSNGNYNNTPNTCYACHQQNYTNTTNPPHASIGFNTDCVSCHSQSVWKPSTFNHDQQYFPIYSGKHNGTWNVCADCHTNASNYGTFSCTDCHEHNKTETDNQHQGVSGYIYASAQCFACHPRGSKEGAFNHSTTNFPLTGAHVSVNCSQCHTSGYAGTSTACVSCHQANYNNASNPSHTAIGMSTECQNCHTTTAFTPSTFNHASTGFALTGHHLTQQCSSCHVGTTGGLSNQCFSCHQNQYNTAPNHNQQHYPTTCEMCHTTTAWNPANFNHQNTQFPLTGAHLTVACSNCHQSGYTGTPKTCVSCHLANYNSTTDPNHVQLNYPTTCELCHTTTAWNQTNFNHQNTQFPLTGAHTSVACANCHQNGYSGIPTTCVSCHQTNYNNTTNPSHTNLGLPTTCETCHTTTPNWKPAAFPIHNNYYQLLGAHALIATNCTACHNGNYNNTPNTCYGCHQQNYNTAVLNHVAPGFPHDCTMCHTQSAWTPSTFQHDQQYFPIYSGAHNNRWTLCSDCHSNPANYAEFSCFQCHSQSQTNQQHNGVAGYVYLSSACYNCHPNGGGGLKNVSPNIKRY